MNYSYVETKMFLSASDPGRGLEKHIFIKNKRLKDIFMFFHIQKLELIEINLFNISSVSNYRLYCT